MKPKMMPRPSNQFLFAAVASVLAMGALAVSSTAIDGQTRGGAISLPIQAGTEFPNLPALPAILPR